MRFLPARVHPGVTQQHRFPAERKVRRLASSSPLVWREQREEAEAEAEAGECSRNVLLVFLCLSLCLTAETRTAAVHLLYGENILPQSPRAVESSLPAQTLHRTKVPVLQVFIFDEERAQSASELLGPDLFSSTRTKLPNSETFPSFPRLLSLIFSGTSR